MCEMCFWVAEIPTKPFSSEWKHLAFVKSFTSRTREVLTFTLGCITKYLLLLLTFISWAASFFLPFMPSSMVWLCPSQAASRWGLLPLSVPPPCCAWKDAGDEGVAPSPDGAPTTSTSVRALGHTTDPCTYFCVHVDGLRTCTWES